METGPPPGVSSGVPGTDGTTIGDVAIIERAGHFLQLEQPDVVGKRIVDFLSATSA